MTSPDLPRLREALAYPVVAVNKHMDNALRIRTEAARAWADLLENGGFRVFIGKHPCDDQPYIVDTDPDPRDAAFAERFSGIHGEDYSGWYVRIPRLVPEPEEAQ